MSVERILIVNLTRLGDLLQTSPTVAGLRAKHPDAEVTLLAERNFAEVCEAIPGVDRVERLDLDRIGRLLLEGGARVAEAYHLVHGVVADLRSRRFDLALNFSSSRMSAVLLGLLGVGDVRGWSMTPDGFRSIRHPWARLFAASCLNRRFAAFNLVDCYRGIAGCLVDGSQRLAYAVRDEARRAITERLSAHGLAADAPLVALQLGASRPVRRWPVDSFARLAADVAADGTCVALIGGAGERELAEAVRRASALPDERTIDLCGTTTIAELAALLERADVLVTGDTGPMHLAAAVGTPVVALFFGPALPFDTGPYGEDHVLLHAAVACAPCDHAVSCLDPFCRTTIRPDVVAAAVRARLRRDWCTLDELAAESAPVRLYRTAFDAHGLFECRAIGTRGVPGRGEEDVRWAYRAAWLAELEGLPLPEPRASRLDLGSFAALAELGRLGGEVGRRLEAAAARRSIPDVERLGHEIETLDRAVAEHGRVYPETAVLTQAFGFEKENVPESEVEDLARAWQRLYQRLARVADAVRHVLGARASREEREHAGLHQ